MNSKDEMGRVCNMRAEVMNAYGILVGNLDGRGTTFETWTCSWEVKCKTFLQETGSVGVD
jgi:hypothetical protein